MNKTIAFLLVWILILPAACSKPAEESQENAFEIVTGSLSEYVIVRGDACEQWETDAAVLFRKTVEIKD